MSEQERRQSSLEIIDEVLDWHPLAAFSAVHLELLELMMAYWPEAEVEACEWRQDHRTAPRLGGG
jgi:hypothetical protein